MYNESRKIEFLRSIDGKHSDDYVSCMNSLFNKSEKFEKMFDKDLCDFNHEEIATMYSMFGYSDIMIYNTFNCNAKKYVEWCDQHMLIEDFINHFSEFGMADYRKYVDTRLQGKKYLSEEEFEKMVNALPNVRDQFLFRCLYEFGKSKNYVEITNMRIGDIDQKNLKANLCTGRTVSVSRAFVNTAIQADEEMKYYFVVSSNERKLEESEFIFKVLRGYTRNALNTNAINFISRIFKKNLDAIGGYDKISPQSIALSGQFNMIRKLSDEYKIDPKFVVFDHFDELRKQYIMTPNTSKAFYDKYQTYL